MIQAKKNSLSALADFPVKNDAMRGLATGNRTGKPAEREQTVYTPQRIVDVCLKVWPFGIELDPCSGPDSIVPAAVRYSDVEGDDGLALDWVTRAYVNPPYKDLKLWLAKAAHERSKGATEQIILCPVRTHRKWFREAWLAASVVYALDPLKFNGYAGTFPAPLCLLYFGALITEFENACTSRLKGAFV